MSSSQTSHQVGHVLARFIATANIIALGLFVAFPPRGPLSRGPDLSVIFTIWCVGSSLLLPAYVGHRFGVRRGVDSLFLGGSLLRIASPLYNLRLIR